MLRRLWEAGRENAIGRLRRACGFPLYAARKEGDEGFPDRMRQLLAKREDRLGDVCYNFGSLSVKAMMMHKKAVLQLFMQLRVALNVGL